jgi:hypothetical protein
MCSERASVERARGYFAAMDGAMRTGETFPLRASTPCHLFDRKRPTSKIPLTI